MQNSKFLTNYLSLSVLIILIVVFSLINPKFASFQNVGNVLKQAAPALIVGTGATFIILMGSIDLSVTGLVALTGITSVLLANVLANFLSPEAFYTGWICILGGVLVGLLVGAMVGVVFTHFRLPSFLVSFGFWTICSGVGLILTNGRAIPTFTKSFKKIGTGTVSGIPNLAIIAVIVLAIGIFLGKKTLFGRNIYAIGGGERVAELCGIPVNRYKIYAFMFAGAMTGLGGTLISARLGAASNIQGEGMALDAIAAVVMGGTALTGGKGGVERTIIGVLILVLISNGLNILGVPTYVQIVIKGIVVILAVASTRDRTYKGIVK